MPSDDDLEARVANIVHELHPHGRLYITVDYGDNPDNYLTFYPKGDVLDTPVMRLIASVKFLAKYEGDAYRSINKQKNNAVYNGSFSLNGFKVNIASDVMVPLNSKEDIALLNALGRFLLNTLVEDESR